jgi:hypothetical protein
MASHSATPPDTNQVLLALLALAIDEREARVTSDDGAARTELVLHSAGLDNNAIGRLLNKQPKMVAQTIRRAEGRGKKAKT